MKSNRKKRILAAILCMVMVLTSNISALAEGESLLMAGQEQTASEEQTPVPEGTTGDAAAQPTQEPVPEPATPEPTPELTPAPTEVPPTPEVTPETTPETAPEPTKEPETPQTPEPTLEPTVTPEPTGTPEPTPEVTPEPEEVLSEATELTQELKDASGQLVQKVTAKLPAGAFQAETSQITMEVTMLDTASENHIKNLMEKRLLQGDLLGDYILYDIKFKMNGEVADALQPITITFEKSDLEIKDVKKANVFYYDPADPAVAGDQDELVEIIQRSEMIERLQNSGQGTEQLEEYDLSSITVGEDKRSGQIELEGRKSTIYGCYVEKQPETTPETQPEEILELKYEDDQVTVRVSAEEAGIIPASAELKVTPIIREAAETKIQYEEVEKQIRDKVAEETKEVVGFLAYDVTFVDKDGNELEPNGKVRISMEYKKAEIPAEVEEKKGTDAEVTVLHLEENENGEVKEVVDMSAAKAATVDTIITTEGQKVKKVEAETESFSIFTIVWKGNKWNTQDIHLVDTEGKEIGSTSEIEIDSARSVSDIAPKISGYSFVKATIGSVNGKNFSKIKKEIGTWKVMVGNSWKGVEREDSLYFVYNKTDMLIDLHGDSISSEAYNSLKEEAEKEELPIQWTRSTGKHIVPIDQSTSWQWNNLMKDLNDDTLTLTKDYEVWDGSRSSDGKTSKHNFNAYLPDNKITVYKGNMYDSATWKQDGGEKFDNFYRFRGSFDLADIELEEGETYSDYNYTIQSVLNNIDRHIYVNDNMYVFVYPQNVGLSNDNFMEYLAFWTGTSNRGNATEFHGRLGTEAYRPESHPEPDGATSVKELAYITDGWYTNPIEDGAGGIIQNALNTGAGTKFYIDVIAHDNAGGGAMYRLQLGAKKVSKTEVSFYKVDKEELKGIQGVKFTLTDETDPTLVYPLTSDDQGCVRVKLKDGSYILKETAAGGGFEKTENTWKVTVENGTFKIVEEDKTDDFSVLKKFSEGDRKGAYYITNQYLKNSAKLVLEKKFVDEDGNPIAAPHRLDHITVTIEGTYRDEKEIYKVDLRADKDGVYRGEIHVISYYDYEVIEERLWKDAAETQEISKDTWELQEVVITRFDHADSQIVDRTTDCAELERPIQDHEFLLLKVKKNQFASQYYLILNHKNTISQETIENILKQSKIVKPAETKIIDFDEMEKEFEGYIQVKPGEAGSSKLTFKEKFAWEQFELGQMDISDYSINGIITNKMLDMSIDIEKRWVDEEDKYKTRPENITVHVKNGTETVKEVTLEAAKGWKTTVTDLPIGEYTIEEVVPSGYTGTYEKDETGKYVITNTLNKNWHLYKISENKSLNGSYLPLAGAKFKMYKKNSESGKEVEIATLTSNSDGKATPVYSPGYEELADGEYMLKETVAPSGYVKSDEIWTITIKDGIPVKLVSDKEQSSAGKLEITNNEDGSVTVEIVVKNKTVYDLPSTGGPGIFVYTIGGTLLLMAAALFLYKMKREEVLKR